MFFSGKLQTAEYSRSEEYTTLSLISWQGEVEGGRISLYTPSSTSLPRHSLPATGQHKTPGWIDISPGTIQKTLKSYLLRYAWRLNIYIYKNTYKYIYTQWFWHFCKNLARQKRMCMCVYVYMQTHTQKTGQIISITSLPQFIYLFWVSSTSISFSGVQRFLVLPHITHPPGQHIFIFLPLLRTKVLYQILWPIKGQL